MFGKHRWVSVAAAGLLASVVAASSTAIAQERGRGGSYRGSGGGGDRYAGRDSDGRGRGQGRDSDGRGRDQGRDSDGRRQGLGRDFTRSAEGRRFDRGVTLREGTRTADRHLDRFFPEHVHSYPHYSPSVHLEVGVYASPFRYYRGVCPPFIEGRFVYRSAPARVFIDLPIYVGGVWHSYRGWGDGYYLNHGGSSTAWRENRELCDAVYDLEDAFRHEDISLLAPLTDPDARIAVFAKGEYDYSLEANDYLDMTRDFMRSAETTGFDILRVQRRASDVYQVFAKHIYRNGDGREESVYLTVVLERVHAHWTITQIDTSPERAED